MPQNNKKLLSEKVMQRKIITYLKSLDRCWVVNFPGVFCRGIPDLLVCYRGHFIGIEIKRPGQKPTKLQTATLGLIEEANGIVGKVTSVHEAKDLIGKL